MLTQLGQAEQARWEVKVHSAIDCPNCMPLIDRRVVPLPTAKVQPADAALPFAGPLLDRCIQLMEAKERMAERTALTIFRDLHGVAFHEHDPPWAHRDIKPANVLLSARRCAVLMDFNPQRRAGR